MDHIGIDVHKRESQIYILAEGGEVIEQRIRTEPERFAAVLGSRPRARIVIEASTDSEWVARCLEALGHEVIVADPNFAPMYATRSRKVKTDRRDARALAEACLLGAYRPAHRLSDPQRHVRGRLLVRTPWSGRGRATWLLIQAAVSILRRRPPQAEELRTWALRIAARRGKPVAVVALARRLAGILYALLRDGSVFAPQRVRPPRPTAAALVNV
jgi:transposase